MKIFSAKINADGHYELMVEYEQRIRVTTTAQIPSRQSLIDQGQAGLANMTDAEYVEDAIQKLRVKLEPEPDELPPVPADKQAQVAGLIGREVKK